jgi:hypothetical protein
VRLVPSAEITMKPPVTTLPVLDGQLERVVVDLPVRSHVRARITCDGIVLAIELARPLVANSATTLPRAPLNIHLSPLPSKRSISGANWPIFGPVSATAVLIRRWRHRSD